ncbi:hypothetical protein HNQ80_002101 [Anaerosolibacter carboniphilus]|uniref:Uncharacterized protein n=1 Tax=Anaerosolibacter carboniphilus TaxID=1417629 RepID=A0A841KVH3_9FIRM|nr:hypothetical protein [Anaerosolibacter carboniphilus]
MVYRRKYQKRRGNFKAFMTLVLLFLFIIYSFMFVDQKIKPAFLAIAQVNACVSLSPLMNAVCAINSIKSSI